MKEDFLKNRLHNVGTIIRSVEVRFVLQETENTAVKQILAHLLPYFDWIEPFTDLEAV